MSHRISQKQYRDDHPGQPRDRRGRANRADDPCRPAAKEHRPPADAPDAGEDPAVAGRDRLQGNEERLMDPGVPSSGDS